MVGAARPACRKNAGAPGPQLGLRVRIPTAWLGIDEKQTLFHSHARDAFLLALSMNDRAAFAGEKLPFNKVGLGSLCRKFHITNESPHDALSDALAEAEVYRAMVTMDLF